MYKFLFYKKFIIFLYMFRALCTHHQEVKIVLYSIYITILVGGRPVHRLSERGPVNGTATYRCDDTRGCVMQF